MAAINQLFQIAYGVELFRSMERPREWGWVLRPSTNEWQHLVHTTDKLLSENLNQKALDAVEARTVNDDGSALGRSTGSASISRTRLPARWPSWSRC
jgi:hypothetical protein